MPSRTAAASVTESAQEQVLASDSEQDWVSASGPESAPA
jgi:hypothetical protein